MARRYEPTECEPKWEEIWEAEGLYRASKDPDDPRPRFYALDMFPYPSGDLHMGHAEAFSRPVPAAEIPDLARGRLTPDLD